MTDPTVTVNNMDIGPCQVKFGTQDIGGTLGNVNVKFKFDKAPLMADQTGKTLLDEAVSGMEVTIETEFAEVQSKVIMAALFPNAVLAGTSPHQYIDFLNKVPARQLALALPLTLHPLVADAGDFDQDWYFYKAIPSEDSSYVFSPSEQGKMKIIWKVYLDLSVTPARMWRKGDQSL